MQAPKRIWPTRRLVLVAAGFVEAAAPMRHAFDAAAMEKDQRDYE
jgi:hypothetical protein